MVLAASRKNRVKFFKVATLQRQAHLQPCNLPFSGSNKVWWRVQRAPFQRLFFAPRRAQNLLAGCIFVGGADKSAFELLSQKVTKAYACRAERIGYEFMQRTISAMVGKGSVNHNSRKFKAENVDAGRSYLNIDYCNENIKKVYHELFDEALARYNAKQTRADRKIANYYEKIRSSKQENRSTN